MTPLSFKRHRFPPQVIRHAIWLCTRFTLSFQDVEEMPAQRGIDVSNETLRCWFLKFGSQLAANLRRARLRPNDSWHIDKMVVVIRDERFWLWRAVDDEGSTFWCNGVDTREPRVSSSGNRCKSTDSLRFVL